MAAVKALNLDQKSQRKFIDYYNEKFTDTENVIFRVFERQNGEFYSIHGKDVDMALKTSLKSMIIVKNMAPDELQSLKYASFNKNIFEKLLRELLLVIGYKVEVYTSRRSEGKSDWMLEFKGSPGNLAQFEDVLFNSNEPEIFTNLLMSIQVISSQQQRKIGIACIDATEHLISVAEFEDNPFQTELEAAVVLVSPKECILPSLMGDYEKIVDVLNRNGVLVTQNKKTEFQNNVEFQQDLEKLVRFKKGQKKTIQTIPEIKLDLAMGSVAAGIKYLELIKNEMNLGQFSVKSLNLKRFVHLDAAAVYALNLFPPPDVNYRSSLYKWQSVLGVLDRCKTNQGRRLLNQWLKQPLRNIDMIRERQNVVGYFVDNQEVRSSLHNDHLSAIPDVLILNNKLTRKRANLQDVFKIYQVILRLPEILELLKDTENSSVKTAVFEPFIDILKDLKNFEEMVEEVLDLLAIERGEYLIKASFDEKLNDIKENMNSIESKIRKETRRCSQILGLEEGSSFKLDYVSHIGFHFRTTRKEDQKLRQQKMFKIIDTARGGIRFTTSTLENFNSDFSELKESYEEQQKDIVQEIVRVASGYSTPLMNLNNLLATLDVFVSLAEVATNSPGEYVRPKMYPENERILSVNTLRHPCLECQDDINFIPNDVNLKENDTHMYIITGANISGKSTYIRSIGVAVLLAHIGSFVPCEEAHISICDSILARVGANDNIQKGLSTFMVEMVETSSILQTATDKSLVIIDELGRGTSTFEGLGLAWSIAEFLLKEKKCFTFFATHFHEITALAEKQKTAKNYHLAAITDDNRLTLLFQVRPGPIDRSFGIQVAEIAQLPLNVLNDAKKFLKEIETEQHTLCQNNQKLVKIDEMLKKIKEGMEFDVKMLECL
ncbi:CLUMA_CG005717, isoform A [Clunio marinus]|uniref:CLUMA_CG005717, isoform A n=1 Tax=Clunio marinus TaxID=568069 RepID=A0A1J1HVM7_9DIPT|nr:CLUMA_CG005717, isoform A [Clunio marinus]